MNQSDFSIWENKLGFKSPRTIRQEYDSLIENATDDDDLSLIKDKYSNKLRFLEDDVVRYNFYLSSYHCLLNVYGEVKIGGIYYKFTKDTEYISLDGDERRVPTLNKSIMLNDSLLISISNQSEQKSLTTDILWEGVKTVTLSDNIKRRLIYSLETAYWVGLVNFNPFTGSATWRRGYSLTLVMEQEKWERKNWFNSTMVWKSNKAWYWVADQYVGLHGVVLPGGILDYTFPDEYYEFQSGTINHLMFGRQEYIEGNTIPSAITLPLRKVRVRFWSSGIEEDNAITIDW
jgi:hypothetical protein